MGQNYYHDYLRELERDPDSRPKHPHAAAIKRRNQRRAEAAELVETLEDTEGGFNPSFHGSKHEREWILTYLGPFYHDNVIRDVLKQVKGGKEATVYCCEAYPATGQDLIAAKVYRPQMFRNLRNDAIYREGRAVLDESGKAVWGGREYRAMAKKTRFGQDLRHLAWLSNEYETLQTLHAAGADVPRPFAFSENAILMEYLGTPDWPAPVLQQVTLTPEEAHPLFERLLWNVELMLLDHNLVHGDLSAHNILYWQGQATIIDFPQAVGAYQNPHAEMLLARDVERLCQYFARFGVATNPVALARDLWRRYLLAEPGE